MATCRHVDVPTDDARCAARWTLRQTEIEPLGRGALAHDADRRPRPRPRAAGSSDARPPRRGPVEPPSAAGLTTCHRVDAVVAQLDALDARITSVSTELANQLSELGHDIDALQRRAGDGVADEALEEVRDAQVRLANEQARYQIAFREDLARLAEQLKRPRDLAARRPSVSRRRSAAGTIGRAPCVARAASAARAPSPGDASSAW